jgi:uncharacterized protein YqjF (DUF2071 family)
MLRFLGAAARQSHTLDEVEHRPWPPPDEPWSLAQSREDVLLVHWPVPLDDLARLGPPGLPIDTHEGQGWLGLAAFRLTNLRLRGLPPLPGLAFAQVDVFTYVTLDGRPGIWLHSLDASNRVLAEAAKRSHRLPAYPAAITGPPERPTDDVGATAASGSYEMTRDDLAFSASFRALGGPFTVAPGSLEHFLTERYCLYTADGGRIYRAELHHAPWMLQRAEASITNVTISPVALEAMPVVLCSASQDLLVWPLEEV